jgi:hypothetical protein
MTGVSLSTTVSDLRLRLQRELPFSPALESVRLIYQGRAPMDEETLAEILRDNVSAWA